MAECDMGCQPDWHHDECAIYLSDVPMTPDVPDPTVEALSEDVAGSEHFAAFDNTGTGDFVCQCGLPWEAGQGCAYLRGARAILAARAAAPDALRVRIEALAELSEAATPGEWSEEVGGSEGYYVFGPRGLHERMPLRRDRIAAVTWGSFESDKANAALIVAAVNLVRALLEDPALAGRATGGEG